MTQNSPGYDVATVLDAAAVASLGTDLFAEFLPDSPNKAVICKTTGGPGANPKYLLDRPTVQVLVRCNPQSELGAFTAGWALALACKNALLGLTPQTVNTTRITGVTMLSDIANIGIDEKNRQHLSMNFILWTEPAAGTYRTALGA